MAVFQRGAFTFLRQLRRNNTREWFEAHRNDFAVAVQLPMRALIEEMDVRLARVAPELVGDPRRSMFRIHRDVRFSRDKSPYKTHAAAWFYHSGAGRGVGGEAHGGAGFYIHVEPGQSSVGGGIWMPPAATLALIREQLAEKPAAFGRLVRAPAFRRAYGDLDSEAMLTRVPRGFAADHAAAEWLRYKSFTAGRMLADSDVLGERFPSLLEREVVRLLPLIRWLNTAIGHAPRARR
ncbi:MAG TPA: DUF2461 domain-containing protein [Gemmatimonadales bacterium]|nr:DUF2461 domain-containing protein [Gemmatimonadales bacterium]